MFTRFLTICVSMGCFFHNWSHAEVIPVYQVEPSSETYLQTVLTHDIYHYAADPGLSDLSVLDNAGNKLPFRIVAPTTDRQSIPSVPLLFFSVPIGTPPETLLILSSASIRLAENAISVSAEKIPDQSKLQSTQPIDFYVIDMSETAKPIAALVIDWEVNEHTHYIETQLRGTNDFQNWTDIDQTTLVQLRKEGQELIRNRINLASSTNTFAYLSLKIVRGGNHLTLKNISAEYRQKLIPTNAADRWKTLGHKAKDQAPTQATGSAHAPIQAWEFSRNDIAPVTKVHLDLGDTTYTESITLFSRSKAQHPWQLVYQGVWFNVRVGAEWQRSDAIKIQPNSDTQWRIELSSTTANQAPPALVYERDVQILQFIANQAPPYRIGISLPPPAQSGIQSEIFAQLLNNTPHNWQSLGLIHLNPDIKLFSRDATSNLWQTIGFFAVLLLAVTLLIGFAFRLYQQLNTSQRS